MRVGCPLALYTTPLEDGIFSEKPQSCCAMQQAMHRGAGANPLHLSSRASAGKHASLRNQVRRMERQPTHAGKDRFYLGREGHLQTPVLACSLQPATWSRPHRGISRISAAVASPAGTETKQEAGSANALRILYRTGWSQAVVHGSLCGGAWQDFGMAKASWGCSGGRGGALAGAPRAACVHASPAEST